MALLMTRIDDGTRDLFDRTTRESGIWPQKNPVIPSQTAQSKTIDRQASLQSQNVNVLALQVADPVFFFPSQGPPYEEKLKKSKKHCQCSSSSSSRSVTALGMARTKVTNIRNARTIVAIIFSEDRFSKNKEIQLKVQVSIMFLCKVVEK